MNRKSNIYLIILILLPFVAVAQVASLVNPSFEDTPRPSRAPRGWYNCGFAGESAPDVQPILEFPVHLSPYQGKTYVGMVVRDNDTWEQLGTKLSSPLLPDHTYTFSLYTAHANRYTGNSRVTGLEDHYAGPAILKLWAGNDYCDKLELLGVSEEIWYTSWQKIAFQFTPQYSTTHILLEAYYSSKYGAPYCGNVLIDFAELTLDRPAPNNHNKTNTSDNRTKVPSSQTPAEPIPLPLTFPKDAAELSVAIRTYGPYIWFDQESANLLTHDFTLNGQAYKSTNQYLAFIAKAMQQFPDYRLLVSVDGDDELRYVRTVNLQEQLLQLGLDQDHLTVYPYNDLDQRKQWLWTPTDNDLLMQIVPIKK